MAIAKRPSAKKVVKRITYEPTQFQKQWAEIKNSFPKPDRKWQLTMAVEANVYAQNIAIDGRYADCLYDPAGYKVKRNDNKKFGVIAGEIFRGKVSEAARSAFAALDPGKRKKFIASYVAKQGTRDVGDKLFFCEHTHVLSIVAEAKQSAWLRCRVSADAVAGRIVSWSAVMGDYYMRANGRPVVTTVDQHTNQNPRDTVDSDWAQQQGYVYIRGNEWWYKQSVVEELGLDLFTTGNGTVIGDYHSSKHIVGFIPSPAYDKCKPPLYMGLELEVECTTHDREGTALKWLKTLAYVKHEKHANKFRYCAVERDGSLSSGFEMVTGFTGLDVHALALKPLESGPFKKLLRSHDTTTCGLHVHIDRADITPMHADKLNMLVNDERNRALVLAVARRYGPEQRYAKILNKRKDNVGMGKTIKSLRQGAGLRTAETNRFLRMERHSIINSVNPDRYQAINFTNRKTVEFRVFRGTLKYETIMSCLEFTRAAWLFSYQYSRADMTQEKFLEFICHPANRADTVFLRPYLTAKGFDTKERTLYDIPKNRLMSSAVLEAEDATQGLPEPKKPYVPKAIAA